VSDVAPHSPHAQSPGRPRSGLAHEGPVLCGSRHAAPQEPRVATGDGPHNVYTRGSPYSRAPCRSTWSLLIQAMLLA